MSYTYVDPLGDTYDISYNYINKMLSKLQTKQAQIKDFEKKYEVDKIQLVIWSAICIVFILSFLIFLRNVKDF
tara:strand:+ start:764 stop:982 length:219 start_codon:yes stop_codon:yes gene_type:complete